MRVWFDTEFIEDGHTIDLISIGMVREDGQEYYAEFKECRRDAASDWVRRNVLPKLTGTVKPRTQIRSEIVEFVGSDPEFWAYYADYDWVALCQLFGTMMHLPEDWPKFCLDFKQRVFERGDPSLQRPENDDHNALADARWLAKTWKQFHA